MTFDHHGHAILQKCRALADAIVDTRLACEVAVIGSLAHKLLALLKQKDPLADKVHLGRGALMATMLGAVTKTLARRLMPGPSALRRAQGLPDEAEFVVRRGAQVRLDRLLAHRGAAGQRR